jgi:hypothetical protein
MLHMDNKMFLPELQTEDAAETIAGDQTHGAE